MKKYSVCYSHEAYDDLKSIFNYIAIVKQEPVNAQKLINIIIETINSLDTFPNKHPEINRQTIHSRCLIVKNHVVFYSVDETNGVVNILRILSCKQDIYSYIKKN